MTRQSAGSPTEAEGRRVRGLPEELAAQAPHSWPVKPCQKILGCELDVERTQNLADQRKEERLWSSRQIHFGWRLTEACFGRSGYVL